MASQAIDPIDDGESRTEVNVWLKMTRWPVYLDGLALIDVAPLTFEPDPASEPLLVAICVSLDRVVEATYASTSSDRVNVFDQVYVTNFLEQYHGWDRPLMIKLRKPTY